MSNFKFLSKEFFILFCFLEILTIPLNISKSCAVKNGDVVITEFMANPLAVSDSNGEWFELYNTTNSVLNLKGWTIRDLGTNSYTISTDLLIDSKSYLVLARNNSELLNGGFKTNHQYNSFVLNNNKDAIMLTQSGGEIVDFIEYNSSSGWTITAGKSLTLINFLGDHSDPNNWNISTQTYGNGDYGTPGTGTLISICGNNYQEKNEECDDGNTKNLDGCSDMCKIEIICFGKLKSDPNVCSAYGTCTTNDTCECSNGYAGDKCQYQNCPVGEYYDTVVTNSCVPCSAGQYQNEQGQISCKNCNAGTYASGSGNITCTACSTGTYQDLIGQSSCTQCPAGYTSGTGTISIGECYLDKPNTPQNFRGGVIDQTVNLSWDAVDFADNYELYRLVENGTGYTLLATPTNIEFIDTNITQETTYTYKVLASNTAGNSEKTESISLTISKNTVITSIKEGQADLPEGKTEITLTGSNVLDISGRIKTKTGGTIVIGGNSKNLNNFTSGTLSGADFTTAQTVGDKSVQIAKAVKVESGTNGSDIRIKNSDFTTGELNLPDGTTVMGASSWDGTIAPPQAGNKTGTNAPTGFSVGNTIVEVGAFGEVLLFDQPVSVIISGVHSNLGYKPADSNNWFRITAKCGGTYANPNAPTFPKECYITNSNVGKTKIYTYHLTGFANLTATATSSGSSNSGGGGSVYSTVSTYTLSTTESLTSANITNRILSLAKTEGYFSRPINLQNTIYEISLEIPKGTQATTADGKNYSGKIYAPSRLSSNKTPEIPEEYEKIFGTEIKTDKEVFFDQDVILTLPIEIDDSAEAKNVKTFYYNDALNQYELVEDGGELNNKQTAISVKINHLTKFVVLDTQDYFENSYKEEEAEASTFSDVESHWAKTYINRLQAMNIVQGKTESNFEPDSSATRAELIKMALLAFDYEIDTEVEESDFTDVDLNAWYAPYVVKAKKIGLVEGYVDGTFRPDQAVKRAETLKIILAASELEIEGGKMDFEDTITGAWYENYVAFAQLKGVVSGYKNKTFGPEKEVTRAEIAKMLIKVMALQSIIKIP